MGKAHLLSDLSDGDTGIVVGYCDGLLSRRRFIEMGLVPGTAVTRIRSAPLGDPIEYAVFGARITIRTRDASKLRVEPRA